MIEVKINVEDDFLLEFIEKLKMFMIDENISEKDILIDGKTITDFENIITSG